MAACDGNRVSARQGSGNRSERQPEIREAVRQTPGAKILQRSTVKEARPKLAAGEIHQFLPAHPCCDARANDASRAGASDNRRLDARLGENLEDADVSQAPDRTAAQGQPDARRTKRMQIAHQLQV